MSPGVLLLALLLSHPDLDEGRVAFSSMKYRAAVPLLTRVTQDPAAAEAEVQEALTLLARAHLALKAPDATQAAFEALLRRAPMTEEPAGSPALRAAFAQAKAAVFPPGTVRLLRRASGEDTLLVEVINPWRLTLVATWHQVEPAPSARVLVADGRQLVTSLAAGVAGYLELTKDGQVVAALGSRAEPLKGPPAPAAVDVPKVETPTLTPVATAPPPAVTPPPAPAAPQLGRRIAGWTLIGLGVAGTATGLGVFAWGSDEKSRGEGWVLSGLDYFEAQRLIASGSSKITSGLIVGGVAITSLAIGIILLLTE
ncbi:MAG: hypothetical protein Q8L48_37185 [Archangium sp.]|nr:hypothetical protein [Archangium sp.]